MKDVYGSSHNDVFTIEFVRGRNTQAIRNILNSLLQPTTITYHRVSLKINGTISQEWEDIQDRQESYLKAAYLRQEVEQKERREKVELIERSLQDPENSAYSDQDLAEKLSGIHRVSMWDVKWARDRLLKNSEATKTTPYGSSSHDHDTPQVQGVP